MPTAEMSIACSEGARRVSVLLILVGLAVMVIALVALIRGKVRWAAIASRKIASGVMVGGFVLLIVGASIAPASSEQRGAVAAPVPSATTNAIAVTTIVQPTTTVVPPPTTTTVVQTTTHTRTTTVAPPVTHKRTTTTEPPHTVHTVAPPANPLTCSASMSDSTPSHNETTDVIVSTKVAGASVMATAHYKTTTHAKSGVATSSGKADIPFDISDATYDRPVPVDVVVSSQGASKSCSTSFTPTKS
jgi:hypothetical protein